MHPEALAPSPHLAPHHCPACTLLGRLSEYEAKLMLPAVVEKAGHNQDKIRQEHRELLRKACTVYPSSKVGSVLVINTLCSLRW